MDTGLIIGLVIAIAAIVGLAIGTGMKKKASSGKIGFGVAAGLTYGKTLAEACCIGVRLASSVICSLENTCPHFLPSEFGLKTNS